MNFFNYDAKNDCNIWERFLKKKTIERDIYHRKFTYNLTTHTYVRQKSSLSEVSLTCQQKENVLIKINNEGRNNNARSRIFYFKSLSLRVTDSNVKKEREKSQSNKISIVFKNIPSRHTPAWNHHSIRPTNSTNLYSNRTQNLPSPQGFDTQKVLLPSLRRRLGSNAILISPPLPLRCR